MIAAPATGMPQNCSAAIAWLRARRVSVSVARTSAFRTLWWVSGYPDAFDAADLVALARERGWQG